MIIIRYEGPKGGPGMPEMLTPTSAIMGAGLGERRRPDHRRPLLRRLATASSSATSRPKPRTAARSPWSRTATRSRIDAEANRIDLAVSDAELAKRRAAWKAPPYKATRGTLYKYIKNVKSASEGCVTDE